MGDVILGVSAVGSMYRMWVLRCAAFPCLYVRTVWCHRPAVLGWQASGVTSQRGAWELYGRRCGGGLWLLGIKDFVRGYGMFVV